MKATPKLIQYASQDSRIVNHPILLEVEEAGEA